MSARLLRCDAGTLLRCTDGRLLRCASGTDGQWICTWTNTACGACTDGYYPGVWVQDACTLVSGSEIQQNLSNSVVIDGNNATSYGKVYANGLAPAEPDAPEPTLAPDQCACDYDPKDVFMVVKSMKWNSGGCVGVPDSIRYESYQRWSVDEELGGCLDHDDACGVYEPACSDCRFYPFVPTFYHRQVGVSEAGWFCSEAEADAWIAENT